VLKIAEMLGKFEWEILEGMSIDELSRWMAYIKINSDDVKRNQKRS
jgi:hypothetical protein